jgi:hypothetical protein
MTDDPAGNLPNDRYPTYRKVPPVPLLNQIRKFLNSPQGRQLTDRGRRYASDPNNQRRAREALDRWRRRR